MPMDGFTIAALVLELKDRLVSSRIEKVYQPGRDTIALNLRTMAGREKLIVSANPSSPRIHLTEAAFDNPEYPPMFCMLLRKHIQGGVICSIEQYGMDRVIEIGIRTVNELGIMTIKGLVCEIIGRHSNIILIDDDHRIIDAIRRVTPDMSSIRQVIPGVSYIRPPSQNKLNILNAGKEQITNRLLEYHDKKCERAVADSVDGIGKVLAREFCLASGLDPDRPCPIEKTAQLADTVIYYKDRLISANITPVIYYNGNKPVEFSPVILSHKDIPYRTQHSVNSMLDIYHSQRLGLEKVEREKESLNRSVLALLDKNRKKYQAQQLDYNQAEHFDRLRIFGELITANLHRLKDKVASVTVENFYDPSLTEITIDLNPNLTPAKNAQRFFKEYNRLKRTRDSLKFHMDRTKRELDYLESVLYSIEKSTDLDDLAQIRQELINEGYIEPKFKKPSAQRDAGKGPLHFMSDDGLDILVGRNNYQNDRLTLKHASKDDLWLHTKEIPGSHVIVRNNGQSIPDRTLLQAAMLAAYYSKARYSGKVPVDYTEVKHVYKPSGAKPGMVIYRNNKTLFVTPDEEIIKQMEIRGDR